MAEFKNHKDGCNTSFGDIPSALYFTAIFLGGSGLKRTLVSLESCYVYSLCVAGIAIYAIPIGALFDEFGEVLGGGDDDEEENNN